MTATEFSHLLTRVVPVLVFFMAITVVAEIADASGVFDVAGHWTAKVGGHRIARLWLLFVGLAVGCTVFLSLDTTAVLLTPVGLAIAAQLKVSPLPFALTTLWLANTASLLLPVSSLTNLLALHHFEALGVGHVGYVRTALWPAIGAIVGTVAVLALTHRKALRGRYRLDAPPEPHDPLMLRISGGVCLAIGPLFAIGLSPAGVSVGAALVLLAVTAFRSPRRLRGVNIPWAMTVGIALVFVLTDMALQHGLQPWLARAAGSGTDPRSLAQAAGAGALAANAVDNLPAYIALEAVTAGDVRRLMALLIGVNVGPLVTPWASLATLLWARRCRTRGVIVPAKSLALQGLACALVAGGLALGALISLH
jgi:arsenical pump membrane protein